MASYLGVAFAYFWPVDFRDSSPAAVGMFWLAFAGRTFLFHLGLLLTLDALLVAWRRRWRLLLAIAPLLPITMGPELLPTLPSRSPAVAGETVTVMSVNLLATNRNTGPIVAEIRAAQPDILLLQEYTPLWRDALQAAVGSEYPYVRHAPRTDSFGAAIYSRLPFVGEVSMDLPIGGVDLPQMRAVVRIADREVALYNIHLVPPMPHYFALQSRQFADFRDLLAEERLPTIVGGDFNFTDRGRHAAALHELGYTDAHTLGGSGRGTTWPNLSASRYLPGVRIDHFYLSGELTCVVLETGDGEGSDHRPIVAEVGFAD